MPYPRTPTTHRHAHMCTHVQVHKHVALDRKHMRHLCPSVFSPATRHLFHLPTHAAGSPQGCLANVHHPIELPGPQPSSIPTPSPSLYPYHSSRINISVRALWMQGTETHSSWFNNKVCEGAERWAQVIVGRHRSHGTPKRAATVGPGIGNEAAAIFDFPSRGLRCLSWCLCSSPHICSILLFLLTYFLLTFAQGWSLTFGPAPSLSYSL